MVEEVKLSIRYDLALETDNPQINYTLNLAEGKCMLVGIAGTPVIIAAISLKESV
ncbi:MAG: hypothetical protein JSS64_11415 [Bacteroidetes bacterium]|nr:hypothetical protein [Bacteroidota bacterium]